AVAGIAHNGVALRTLAESVVGRALLDLLALADKGFRRDDVCALFARAPILDGHGRFVPATAWERVSRRAGVVGGGAEWSDRLGAYIAGLGDTDNDEHERAYATELRSFVGELAERVGADERARSWRAWSRFAHGLLRSYVGDERRRESWPLLEQEAAR